MWTDEVQAYAALLSTLIAGGSVVFVIASLRQASNALTSQNKSADVASVLSLFERLDIHWCRFKNETESDKVSFEFGQLISYYELSCGLFRDRIFSTKAAITLYEHLHDVLTAMQDHEDFRNRLLEIKSQSDNYENIVWLCNQPRSLPRCRSATAKPLFQRIFQSRAAY